MDKKQIRKCHKMDLSHFLRNYYGVDNNHLISELSNLSHKELKKIAAYYGINLASVNFDSVSVEQIKTGMIILVNDAFNNSAPYINPNRTLSRHCEFETDLDLSNISSVEEEVKFDKKGRQKSFKRIIRLRKGD